MTFLKSVVSGGRNRRGLWFFLFFCSLILCNQATIRAQQKAEIDFQGFKADYSQVRNLPQIETVIKAVKRQIEIVGQVNLSRENTDFFKSVSVIIIPDSNGTPGSYSFEKNIVYLKARDLEANKPILLHEYLHAYHNLRIPNGAAKAELREFYQKGITAFPNYKGVYFLSNPREFFAVTASIYLFGNIPRPPFNSAAIEKAQPEYYKYLETLFGKKNTASS